MELANREAKILLDDNAGMELEIQDLNEVKNTLNLQNNELKTELEGLI